MISIDLAGKNALVLGVANKRSLAWTGCFCFPSGRLKAGHEFVMCLPLLLGGKPRRLEHDVFKWR